MRIKINVTQEDIDCGAPTNCGECPLARAIRRALPGYEVRVYGEVVSVRRVEAAGWEEWFDLTLPWVARCFVYDVDAGHFVTPIAFTLEIAA